MRKVIAIVSAVLLSSNLYPANAADTISITESADYTAVVEVVGQVWKGKIPTKIAYPAGSSSQKLEFQIQGILPQSVLGDRATGTDVEFEIWSDAGKKIASDTVYSFDWNPVGPNTLVSMYLYESDAIGTHTMIVRTIFELSTTGLLTRYIKSEQRFTVRITSAVKPGQVDLTSGASFTNGGGYALGTKYSFTPLSSPPILRYEVGMMVLKSPGLDLTNSSNYLDPIIIKTLSTSNFEIYYDDIKQEILKYTSDLSNSAYLIKVRAVSEGGAGPWGKGYYTETKDLVAADTKKKLMAEAAEAEKQARVNRCNELNVAVSDLNKVAELYASKYPMNVKFLEIKSQIPGQLDCTNASDVSMATIIQTQDSKLFSVDFQLKNAISLADNPPAVVKKKTIICVKGKLTKKVTGTSPKCPSGYKKK